MTVDHRFFRIVDGVTVADLASKLGAVVKGEVWHPKITGVAPLTNAGEGDLTFQTSISSKKTSAPTGSTVITNAECAAKSENNQTLLIVDHPRKSFAEALGMLIQTVDLASEESNIDQTAMVHPNASVASGTVIGANCQIGAGAVIQAGVVIGDSCIVGSNCVLSHCRIGSDVSIGAGSIIGDSGFGFEMTNTGAIPLPHIGIVRIANGCSIGSHCAIDRGSLGDTVIGNSVMIDNLCHIAHNVQLGERVIMAGQCGVSGSVTIGADVQIGGQVGIAPHLKIGDRAILTARSGITKDVASDCQVAGFPAINAGQFWRERVAVRRLAKSSSDEC